MGRMITSQAAAQIALQKVPGQLVKIELGTEDDVLVYEVDIITPYGLYELDVDANTGAVIKIDFDND